MSRLLTVNGLTTEFKTERGIVRAVNNISYTVDSGEIVGVVGESGCGKSVSQMSIMGLIPSPPGKVVAGSAIFANVDLLKLKKESKEMCEIRGNRISMIFQEPMTSLNPALTVNRQMSEMLLEHKSITKKEARERVIDMLRQVGIPDPESRADDYPHQMSGGMRQRVMVGMAMICEPSLIIADEATTALDATIQAQLLEMMNNLVREHHTAMVMVTHNLGIVARYADRINVMYAGSIIESGTVKEIWANPLHPYTESLIHCVPQLGQKVEAIPGMPPSLINRPPTCPFLPRCKYRQKCCFENPVQDLTLVEGTHSTMCALRSGGAAG